MKKGIFVVCIILISYLALVIYANRALYFSRFDESYWKDKYEHSQWKLPLSIRTIGDDGLYLYEGYRLATGGDPTLLNAEVPPLGKYLIGGTILFFHNAFVYGMWTILLLLMSIFLLAKRLFHRSLPALTLTLLLATDPLITGQYALTMLDGIQATFLVIFLVVLFLVSRVEKKYQWLIAITAGVTLGLFSETKAPVLLPVLTVCGLIYLWVVTKKPFHLIWFLVTAVTGYLLPYISYFLQGHTFIEWVKVQKWIASFYLNGNLTATWGSVITTLVFGRFQNIYSRSWEAAGEWSPVWGVLLFAAIGSAFRVWHERKLHREWMVVLSLLFLIIGFYALIPFWSRYLVTILPLLYLAGGFVTQRLPAKLTYPLFAICLVINLVASVPILFPSPEGTVRQFIHNTQYMFFADLYEDTTTKTKQAMSRNAFRRFGLQTMTDGQIERIDIRPKTIPSGRTSPQFLTATVTFFTRELGSYTRDISIPFVLEDNRWRISWDWSYLLPGLTPTMHVETTVIPARRGSILASDKTFLARDTESYLISITPGLIEPTKEQELLALLERLFGPGKPLVYLHQRIYGNSLGDTPVPVGVFSKALTNEEYTLLTGFRGVTLTPHAARVKGKSDIVTIGDTANTHFFECCSYLYSTTTYDGVTGVEYVKNSQLKGRNGGTLTIVDDKGTMVNVLISLTKQDGIDVEP